MRAPCKEMPRAAQWSETHEIHETLGPTRDLFHARAGTALRQPQQKVLSQYYSPLALLQSPMHEAHARPTQESSAHTSFSRTKRRSWSKMREALASVATPPIPPPTPSATAAAAPKDPLALWLPAPPVPALGIPLLTGAEPLPPSSGSGGAAEAPAASVMTRSPPRWPPTPLAPGWGCAAPAPARRCFWVQAAGERRGALPRGK